MWRIVNNKIVCGELPIDSDSLYKLLPMGCPILTRSYMNGDIILRSKVVRCYNSLDLNDVVLVSKDDGNLIYVSIRDIEICQVWARNRSINEILD